jgi:signal transduction histidine kinase
MWLTLVACVGMATLVVPVVRARHELAAPLSVLIADMIVWNLAWLAFRMSGEMRWHWLEQCAGSLVMVLGLDFVLTFVGRRRELRSIRLAAFLFYGAAFLSSASRFAVEGSPLFPGQDGWLWWMACAGAATTFLIAVLLVVHYRAHRDGSERAHTRLLMIGLSLWLILAATDLVHWRVSSVPQMSAVGMLLSAAVMAIVMDRVRADGPSRWWALYTVVLFLLALSGNVLVFKALPTHTAMTLARTIIFVAVAVACLRETIVMIVRRRERLAELVLVGRVTAQMAHDLQNPLAALKCAVQVLEEDRLRGHGGATDRQRRMLDLIATQTERLSAIVDDYRRVGRIEPLTEAVSLADIAGRAARPVGVELRHALGSAPRCRVDPELVARAIENLTRNAAEAMPEGGHVLVSAEATSDDWVEVTVADDGPGMDARTCERAFDDFFTTKAKGSGLGLAFVRRVAEAHGGNVRVASRVGMGTRVTLRLPAANPRPELQLHRPVRASRAAA